MAQGNAKKPNPGISSTHTKKTLSEANSVGVPSLTQSNGLFIWICGFFLSVGLTACASVNTIHPPITADEPLPIGTPESVGLDASRLENVSNQLAAMQSHKLHSMLVLRSGLLVFEEYYNGYGRDNPHDLRSATKSITSLLTGAALDQGVIPSVESPIMDFLAKSYPNIENKDDIQTRHLLTMSSGLDCDDFNWRSKGQEDRLYRTQDWVASFLALPPVHAPGEVARYCTAGVIALGEVIAQASGMGFSDFADDALFGPLGIHNYRWARFDNDEKVDTGGHLLLTPQGMAKLGLLVLQEGQWEGHQLISREWIQESTQPQTQVRDTPYGYLWWMDTLPYGEKRVKVIWASGNGGQLIFIVPEYDLVAVFTAGFYNSDKTAVVFDIFYRSILPSVIELQSYLSGNEQ